MTGKVKLDVTREVIAHALRKLNNDIEIPDDAAVVGVEYNAEYDTFECVLTSAEWPEVPEGAKTFEVGDL